MKLYVIQALKAFSMKSASITILPLFLIGCSSSPGLYNPNKLAKDKLVRVEAAPTVFLKTPISTQILNVFNSKGELVIGVGDNMSFTKQDRWDKVYLAPGRYRIMAHCNNPDFYALPYADINVKNGNHYVVECTRSKTSFRKIKLSVKTRAGNDS